jgi:hypothetical protein
VAPGQSVTLALDALGATQGVGAATVDVGFDPAIVSVTGCTADPASVFDLASCNPDFASDTVRFVGISAGGVSGDLALADLTFQAVGSVGDVSPLNVTVQTFADTNGFDILNTDEDGSIDITPCPDSDGDGFDDCVEAILGTDPLAECPTVVGAHDAWPPDFDENRVINTLDVIRVLPPSFGLTSSSPDWNPREDLLADGVINMLDVIRVLPPTFGQTCTP